MDAAKHEVYLRFKIGENKPQNKGVIKFSNLGKLWVYTIHADAEIDNFVNIHYCELFF